MTDWDPDRYQLFADERSRPFADLVGRIAAVHPRVVVDLGCGPGPLTAGLARRWPDAQIIGVDSSPAMVEAAAEYASPNLRFELADLRDWQPSAPVDVLVSNAALQWVPGHRSLLPRLTGMLREHGWLAVQVPGNVEHPSHRLLRRLADDPRFAGATAGLTWPHSAEPADYLADLVELGCRVDVWETTYLHVLTGPDPVFTWLSGTGARPVLQALTEQQRAVFAAEYRALLSQAYPARRYGTVLPFRRIFVVAQRGDRARA